MNMEEETLIVLTLQLIALSGIAASLLVYLMCKAANARRNHTYNSAYPTLNVGSGRSVLITSCETVFGIQLAIHLASLGFRVFAGVSPNKEGEEEECESLKILRTKLKQREAMCTASVNEENEESRSNSFGTLIVIPVDVTREDSLHEALDQLRRHLPVGQEGLWAVICTSGICYKGKVDQQESYQWEAMFKLNVFGVLRTARTFMQLLKNKKGRLITIGMGRECAMTKGGAPSVVYNAARYAVVGASVALREEMLPFGIQVTTIHAHTIPSEKLFALPKLQRCPQDGKTPPPQDKYLKYDITVVPDYALEVLEEALLVENPKAEYEITKPTGLSIYLSKLVHKLDTVQKKKKYTVGHEEI